MKGNKQLSGDVNADESPAQIDAIALYSWSLLFKNIQTLQRGLLQTRLHKQTTQTVRL